MSNERVKYTVQRKDGNSWTTVVVNCPVKGDATASKQQLKSHNPTGHYRVCKVTTVTEVVG